MNEIKNAIIESVSLTIEDHGLLTAWVHLDYGGSVQGFGGYALYLPKDFKHGKINSGFAGHFIFRCLEISGAYEWKEITGKTVRVEIENGIVSAIGHIVKNDWFCPAKDFKTT